MNKSLVKRAMRVIFGISILVLILNINTGKVFAGTYKNFVYQKTSGGKTVEVTGYKGNPTKIVIPEKIGSKKVTSIGTKAFMGKGNLTSVAIPSTVKTIKSYAFYNCKKLKNVNVSASVGKINSFAFGYGTGRKRISGFKIAGNMESAAYRYALYNDMSFVLVDFRVGDVYTERLKSTQTNLSWSEVKDATGYEIYRADASGKSYKKIAQVVGTTYSDVSITDGNIYCYKIKAFVDKDGKKIYGSNSKARMSEWGKYNNVKFESVTRNKSDMNAKEGVYYELFVRSFADSDGDGIGDFNGITAKLDYLKDLGIDGIWLMPINASSSYHGYDVDDYYLLNSDYGTEEEFENMLTEAHKRGIKVIMDFVINHTSNTNKWFVSAMSDVNSPYRDYYRFVSKYDTDNYSEDDESPWGSYVWQSAGNYYYYSAFYGFMPDLNYNNPKVREEIKAAAAKWLNMGVDGFRLDAAMHIYGVHEFKHMTDKERTDANLQWWNEFAAYCEGINKDVYLVGEAWQNEEVLAEYVQPFDTKFDFTMEQNMMSAISNGSAVLADGKNLADSLQDILNEYAKVDTKYLDGVFGSNHDQNRIMSQVNGDVNKAKLAANIYLTLAGNPYLYYGEEIGMSGSGMDENKRTPFIWDKETNGMTATWEGNSQNKTLAPLSEQLADDNSMYMHYKKLIALRKSYKALMSGSYKAIETGKDAVMAYERISDNDTVVVLHNLSSESVTVDIKDIENGNVIYQDDGALIEGTKVTIPATGSVMVRK